MKLKPSIAFSDFSGTAGEVTARKVGDKTFLSTRTKHSHLKTPSQASARCRFSDTTRGYSSITEEQRHGWITLANNLGTFSTSSGMTSMTGHNLFVLVNSYRKICGKPQCADAPDHLTPSHYIGLDDLWLTPDKIIFTGLRPSGNPNDVLLIEMYPAESPAATRSWNKTAIVTVVPSADWGDADISKAFIEKFGRPLELDQLVFVKICWIDSECGYLKWYTMIAMRAREESIFHNREYVPRVTINTDQIINTTSSEIENFNYEMSPGSKITSDDITAKRIQGISAGCEFTHNGLDSTFRFDRSYQLSRGTEEHNYMMQCIEVLIQNSSTKSINLSNRGGIFKAHFETFGTYYVTN